MPSWTLRTGWYGRECLCLFLSARRSFVNRCSVLRTPNAVQSQSDGIPTSKKWRGWLDAGGLWVRDAFDCQHWLIEDAKNLYF